MRLGPTLLVIGAALGTLFVLLVPSWHLPVAGTQLGPRPSSMIQWANADKSIDAINTLPPPPQQAAPDPRPATAAFKNVQVLTDTNAGEFMQIQYAITAWVSPAAGCAFCHQGDDYASDAKATKRAARTMLQMTRHINADWQQHAGPSGVTCYTCHRGEPVPSYTWFPHPSAPVSPWFAKHENWNEAARTVRDFFPDAGWSEYLLQDTPVLAQGYTAERTGGVASQVVIKRLYEMMMQYSDGIGVNCGYCHNSRAFFDWNQSTPARWAGYNGMQLTRDLNRNFLLPLAAIIPQVRRQPGEPRDPVIPNRQSGEQVGNGLVVCATCHYGTPKPMNGADMMHGYKGLQGTPVTAAARAEAEPSR